MRRHFLDYIYKIETHCHTKEFSPCGQLFAKDVINLYKEHGYDGINITDHFAYYLINKDADPDKEIERFYSGCQIAIEEGDKAGIKVYHGAEYRLNCADSNNEYLLFGASREFLKEAIGYFDKTYKEFYEFAKSAGVLVYQAHPFRDGMSRTPDCCDGVEVYNAHPGHNSRNNLALEYVEENGLLQLSGSDCHHQTHAGRGGILTKVVPQNDLEFFKLIKSNDFRLIRSTEN
ncbi:MAG: hypothetical protein DBX47_04745 [Clostridiales bacterium]|nr:MAG: hypothetical protein DBX47_04745 [Clostridiales bacterium]